MAFFSVRQNQSFSFSCWALQSCLGKKCENLIKLSRQRFFKAREGVAAVPARKDYLERGGREGFARERNRRVASQLSSLFKRGPKLGYARGDAPKGSL